MKEFTTGARLVFFVLVRFVHGETAEFIRHFEQVLVSLVPFCADFAEEHRPLVGPSELEISNLADVGAEPACIFHIVAVGEFRVREPLHHFVELAALECPGVHRQKRRPRSFGEFNEILPAVGIVPRIPHDTLHLFVVHEAVKTAHAVTFDEGDHVVFYCGEIVRNRGHIPIAANFYCIPFSGRAPTEAGQCGVGAVIRLTNMR